MSAPTYFATTIANGTSLSAVIDLRITGAVPGGIQMPAAWTAANLTFQVSVDGTTYQDFFDSTGVEVTVTAAAAHFIALDPTNYMGIRFLKIRSGTTGTPVNQGADRVLQLSVRMTATG